MSALNSISWQNFCRCSARLLREWESHNRPWCTAAIIGLSLSLSILLTGSPIRVHVLHATSHCLSRGMFLVGHNKRNHNHHHIKWPIQPANCNVAGRSRKRSRGGQRVCLPYETTQQAELTDATLVWAVMQCIWLMTYWLANYALLTYSLINMS